MKEIAIKDAEARFSSLVKEIQDTGEEVVILSQGKPIVRMLAAAEFAEDEQAARQATIRLVQLRDRLAEEFPSSAEPISWEVLKRWMRDEDKWDALLK